MVNGDFLAPGERRGDMIVVVTTFGAWKEADDLPMSFIGADDDDPVRVYFTPDGRAFAYEAVLGRGWPKAPPPALARPLADGRAKKGVK